MQYPKGWLAPVGTALLILSTVTQYSDGAAIGNLGSIDSSSSLSSTSYASLFESGTTATQINHRSPRTKPSAATATTYPTLIASVSLSSSSRSGNEFLTNSRSSQDTTSSVVTSSDRDISPSSVILSSSSSPSKKLDSSSTASRTTSSRDAEDGSNSSASSNAKTPATSNSIGKTTSASSSKPSSEHDAATTSSSKLSSQHDAASATSSETSSGHDASTSERSTSRSSDLESTKSSEASGSSSSNGASSKASPPPNTSTISDAPAVQVVTAVVSGTTEKVPVISDTAASTPITLAPVTTTIATSQATSSASSVSTELAALIPILKSWKKDPTSKKSNTLNKIKDVKSHVEGFISEMGTESSSKGCGSNRKRSALSNLFGDITGSLSCIDKGLDDATDKVNTNNVDAIDSTVENLTTENTNLDNDSKNNDSKDNESKTDDDSSTSESSSKTSKTSSDTSSSTSSCTTHTALHVTTKCVPTSKTTGGSTISTTTCTPSTTVTTEGCSVTGLTTTISSSASSTSYPLCASGKCGNGSGCKKYTGPLSGDLGATMSTTKTCSSVSTVTTDVGTASFGTFRSAADAAPTSDSNTAKRSSFANETLPETPLNKRVLVDVEPADYSEHVSTMSSVLTNKKLWASQYGDTSGTWSDWSTEDGKINGMNGIYGCTVVFIVSTRGVYASHIWQVPVFVNEQNQPTATDYFHKQTFMALRDGVPNEVQSLVTLIGTDANKGVLHPDYNPQVHVVTPFASDGQTLEYSDRAYLLADMLTNLFAKEATIRNVWGYHRYNQAISTAEFGFLGRTIVEHDPLQYVIETPQGKYNAGRWRLWVENSLVWEEDYYHEYTQRLSQRDLEGDVCLVSNSSSESSTSSSSSTSTTFATSASKSTTSSSSSSKTSKTSSSSTPTITAYYQYDSKSDSAFCEVEGHEGSYQLKPSSSGVTSHQPCDWSTMPPTLATTPITAYTTYNDGTVGRCTDGQYGNANVNDIPTCTGSASVFSTNAAVASAFSSSAAAAEASQKADSGDCTIIHSDDLFGDSVSSTFYLYNLGTWADEGKVYKQEDGCGALDAWVWEKADDGTYKAGFDLSGFPGGCIERAIVSAGGPKITCNDLPGKNENMSKDDEAMWDKVKKARKSWGRR